MSRRPHCTLWSCRRPESALCGCASPSLLLLVVELRDDGDRTRRPTALPSPFQPAAAPAPQPRHNLRSPPGPAGHRLLRLLPPGASRRSRTRHPPAQVLFHLLLRCLRRPSVALFPARRARPHPPQRRRHCGVLLLPDQLVDPPRRAPPLQVLLLGPRSPSGRGVRAPAQVLRRPEPQHARDTFPPRRLRALLELCVPVPLPLCSSGAAPDVGEGEIEVESQSRGRLSNVAAPVPEYREKEEEDVDEEDDRRNGEVSAGVEATEVGEDYDGSRGARPQWAAEEAQEEEEKEMGKKGPVRPMKDHIDLDAHSKKPPPKDLKEIAGSFWLAASVFSKKLQKWRRKQKEKKHRHDTMGAGKTPAIGPVTARPCSRSSRRFSRDAQSEVAADYTFGRRSCDTEPRFSLDAGRVSFDDPRFSWDEPRASWDGYLTGGAGRSLSLLPRLPPMLSVLEDAPVVPRSDGQIPVEEDAAATPGGSSQTRDYYLDSSSSQRRRRSLDRSSSRRSSVDAASAAELLKPVSTDARLSTDAKLSPTAMGADEYLHHVSKFERDYNSSSLSALHVDDCWESLEKSGAGGGGGGGTPRKPRVWSKAWSLWGLIHRRRSRGGGGRMVERSLSETWQVLPGEGHPRKFGRSNSNVGCRHSFHGTGCSTNGGGALGITRRSGLEINGHGKKRREEFVLERCQSSRRFSPNHGDGGLPRFYVTPAPPSSTGLPKGRCKSSHAPPRSVLRLY